MKIREIVWPAMKFHMAVNRFVRHLGYSVPFNRYKELQGTHWRLTDFIPILKYCTCLVYMYEIIGSAHRVL